MEFKIIKYNKYKQIYEHLKTKIGHDPARIIIKNVYEYDKKNNNKNWLLKKIHKITKQKILRKPHSLFTACFKNFEYDGSLLNPDKLKHISTVEKILKFDKFCYEGKWFQFTSQRSRSRRKVNYCITEINEK